jgi:hypothetical protein
MVVVHHVLQTEEVHQEKAYLAQVPNNVESKDQLLPLEWFWRAGDHVSFGMHHPQPVTPAEEEQGEEGWL